MHFECYIEGCTADLSALAWLLQRHTVVLNWNECMVPLLRQIAIAKTEYKDRGDLSRIVRVACRSLPHASVGRSLFVTGSIPGVECVCLGQ